MFQDYYKILDILQNASEKEIKSAFKKQAIKWHPDKNQEIDTTEKMQLINEAKLILLDAEARRKYDFEYNRFKKRSEHFANTKNEKSQSESSSNPKYSREDFGFDSYEVEDEELFRWMSNAKKQSVDLAKKTIKDFKGMVKAGATAAAKEAANVVIFQVGFGFLIFLIIMLSRACNS